LVTTVETLTLYIFKCNVKLISNALILSSPPTEWCGPKWH